MAPTEPKKMWGKKAQKNCPIVSADDFRQTEEVNEEKKDDNTRPKEKCKGKIN